MLKGLSSALSFLTILPAKSYDLKTVARYMYVFPIIGLGIGLLIGLVGYGASFYLDPIIVSLLVVVLIVIVTGIHHTDGLADFADGLMTKGDKTKKLQSMKDVSTGSAGIVSIVLYMIGLIIALSMTSGFVLLQAILLSEVLAKFSMVLMASMGKSASLGSNSPFIQLMRDKKKLLLAASFTLVPIYALSGNFGFLVFGAVIGVSLLLLAVSNRNFGGITGDVMGAANDICRLTSVIIFVSV
ncbi:MAG: adenosylcobinamide-GDP ribazoletransferase [Nitrosopumilaceae archaeon]|nr:adenosylcobinamide-GDP ribazoletransferase [Nitrosopumilaceae archaeon]NIT99968.1 adenosylcobinamide-GDP ribazoletransferase [Nitrosopumilaceae archaeon]NIU86323.1 adenosylcobinamide-GDP ribazoletransferase [Nitrosopumilaceae archaeon]NIV65078.1 adenosylcobinamide-GDP ribazoletransferase [Nitrosopumilaceae archaeon]NIX60571.1 adenosylcobinamide-GDP ribazoletransferase [Nitrosopumilaceae archaeon]